MQTATAEQRIIAPYKAPIKRMKRGEIWMADLSGGARGSEQSGFRPVLIIQNDKGNNHAPTTIVVSISSQISKAKLPTHVELDAELYNLEADSVLLAEQIRTIDKSRLKKKVAELDDVMMRKVNRALAVSIENF